MWLSVLPILSKALGLNGEASTCSVLLTSWLKNVTVHLKSQLIMWMCTKRVLYFVKKKKNRDQQIALIVCLCLTGSAVESVTLPVISVWEGEDRVWVDRLVWMWPWIISPFLYLSEFYTLKYYFVVWIEFLAEDDTAHSHVKDH